MAYAVAYEVPSNERLYHQVKERIGEMPASLKVQLVVTTPSGLRHISVWDTKQDWQEFRDGRIRPAVNGVLAGMGIAEPPAPEEEELSVVDVYGRT